MNRRLCLAVLLCLWLCAAFAVTATAFDDVLPGSAFYDAVNWAVENGITNGTGENTFSPKETCTIPQILTFLYRYSGSLPAPGNVFSGDVPEKSPYWEATNWAFQNGIESGHRVDGKLYIGYTVPCTRSSAVIYLWRLSGRPTGYEEYAKQFKDIQTSVDTPELNERIQAVGWAVYMSITNGTSSDSFSPDAVCTRGQIVTFLYRYDLAIN